MKSTNIKCIVLGHKNFSEKDKLVFLYNKELGKISVIAKGARNITSKFTGHLETLNFCTASIYFGPKNIILTEITTDKNYFRKRDDLNTITNALQMAKITNKMLFENQALENLETLMKKTLEKLKTSDKKTLILIAYTIKLLNKCGFVPDFKNTKTTMDEKYLKFFNFTKTKPLSEIEKIKLSQKEKQYISTLTSKLLESVISRDFNNTLNHFQFVQ